MHTTLIRIKMLGTPTYHILENFCNSFVLGKGEKLMLKKDIGKRRKINAKERKKTKVRRWKREVKGMKRARKEGKCLAQILLLKSQTEETPHCILI